MDYRFPRTCKAVILENSMIQCTECGSTWASNEEPACVLDARKTPLDALKCDLHVVNSTPCPLLRCRVCHMGWAITEDPMCPFRATLRTSPPTPLLTWVQLGGVVFLAGLGGFILKALMGF